MEFFVYLNVLTVLEYSQRMEERYGAGGDFYRLQGETCAVEIIIDCKDTKFKMEETVLLDFFKENYPFFKHGTETCFSERRESESRISFYFPAEDYKTVKNALGVRIMPPHYTVVLSDKLRDLFKDISGEKIVYVDVIENQKIFILQTPEDRLGIYCLWIFLFGILIGLTEKILQSFLIAVATWLIVFCIERFYERPGGHGIEKRIERAAAIASSPSINPQYSDEIIRTKQ